MIKLIKNLLRSLFRGRIHYIGGPETLPPPMTAEEEERVIEEIASGNEKAREKLITRNLRLVVYIAKKFEASYSVEDLISIGNIGLIKAVSTYDPGKNIKLATYASRCIENEILMFLRKTSRGKGEVSIDESLNTDSDGNELLLSDVLGTAPDSASQNIEMKAEKELLRSAVEKLPKREKMIMELRFGLSGGREKTQKEVADMIGISQSYISRIEKRTVKVLKKELERQL